MGFVMRVTVTDRLNQSLTARTYTQDGFLIVPGRVARVGIQQYLARELELTDRNPNDIVNVFRPPEEVFNADSLASYEDVSITDDHPTEMVSADSYKQVTVGHVRSGGTPDGDFVVAEHIIKDADAIKKIESGKAELSAGYSADYLPESGTFDGVDYEFVQRNIRINHVALVDRARAGREARLFDNQPEGNQMTVKAVFDGVTVEFADQAAYDSATKVLDGLRADLKKAVADAETEKAKSDKMSEDMEEEKKKTSEDSINALVASVLKVKDAAARVAGKGFTCDSANPLEIKRAALSKARPNVAWGDKSETYVSVAFDMEMEKKESEDEEEEEKKESMDGLKSDFRNLDKSKSVIDAKSTLDAAYKEMMAAKSNAWKENK